MEKGCGCLLLVVLALFIGECSLSLLGPEVVERRSTSPPKISEREKGEKPEAAEKRNTSKPKISRKEDKEEPQAEETTEYVFYYDKDDIPYARVPGGIQVSELPDGSYRWAFRKPTDGSIETGTADTSSIENVRAMVRNMVAEEYGQQLTQFQEQEEEPATTPDLPFHRARSLRTFRLDDSPTIHGETHVVRAMIERGTHTRAEIEQIAIDITRKYGWPKSRINFFSRKNCIVTWDTGPYYFVPKPWWSGLGWAGRYWLCRVVVNSNARSHWNGTAGTKASEVRGSGYSKAVYEIQEFSAYYYGPNPEYPRPDWGDRALR